MAARLDGLPRTDKGTTRKYESMEEKQKVRKAQKNAATKRWKERNKEKVDVQSREYREANAAICIARTKAWQEKNKDRVKDYVYKRKYGITLSEYNEMVSERNGKCDICGNVNKLVIDHCHNSNIVRGLLCDRCNVAIGCFEDDVKRVLSAALYLNKINDIEGYSKLISDSLKITINN